MNHIYLGLSLSLICLFLAYLIFSKFILVTVLCVIFVGLYFKDDFIIFRYLAARVALFYSWICDFYSGIQNMYHQSNNTNFPVRKCIENNGTVSRKIERLHHGSPYNLSTSYVKDNQPLNSGIWGSGSKLSSPSNSSTNRTHSAVQDLSKLNISQSRRGESSTPDRYSKSYHTSSVSPLKISYAGYSRSKDPLRNGPSNYPASRDHSSNVENNPPLNAKIYADVSSPGFCGRVADRLPEEVMTHQPKYDTVGAFPVVNLKSQSPKIKIKTPVRVRLAPPSNELMHYNYAANTMSRSPVLGPDDSMKSVLQVLKEISRKRIHSHIDEENDEGSKRLRVTDSQFDSDGLHHTSLLQQTIQGKRAREESSPNEDDKKRHKASLKNNEILSSLSSSLSVRPPHLQTAKRKAQSIDDSITTTPVLGKLLKVQTEVTPPAPTNHIAAPDTTITAEELNAKTSLSPDVPSPIVPPPTVVEPALVREPSIAEPVTAKYPESEEDGAVSRLLGRMSDQTSSTRPAHIPVKKNVFMSTNDLSLSPPKENRLAAMIAVLGGPSEQSELENIPSEAPKQADRIIIGKALFTTPETPATPETPRQNKKVTFSDSLTTTKVFERDEPYNGNSSVNNNITGLPSTPLSSVTFSSSANTTPTGPKLNIGLENASAAKPLALNFGSSPLSSRKEVAKPIESGNFSMISPTSTLPGTVPSLGNQPSMFQMQPTNLNFTSATSSVNISGPTFSVPAQVSTSSSLLNAPSPGGFSFGTNSSLVNPNKESSSKQNTDSSPLLVKPLSFGGEAKSSQPSSSGSGFPSLFSTATSNNDTVKATEVVSPAGQNKPMFNMFGNKDTNTIMKNEGENKPLVNGFPTTTSSSNSFLLSQTVGQVNASKPLLSTITTNANPTTTSQSALPFNFVPTPAFSTSCGTSVATPQLTFTSVTQQPNSINAVPFQPNSSISNAASPLNIFSSSSSNPTQAKQSPFGGSGIQGISSFGDSNFKPVSSSSQTPPANPVFGNTPSQTSGFGNMPVLQNGVVSSTSGTTQTNNMFGTMSSNTTSKPIMFGNEVNATTQPSSGFGFSGTPATTQTSSPFGISLSNSTSNTPAMFGNTTTTQSASIFGSGTPNTASQSSTFQTPSTTAGQPSVFGSLANNDASKNMFTGALNSNPTFGGFTFGGQSTTATSAFGNQKASAFNFGTGSQSTVSNPSQGGFGSGGTFGSTSSSSTNEVKPPAFGSASPFMFGSSSASKTTEAVKPHGTATPFSFVSSAPQNSSVNQAQPSVPSFGGPTPTFVANQAAPAFGGGTTQSSAPTFGGSTSQPAATAFGGGTLQPAAPTFGGSTSQPAAPTFGGGTSQPVVPTFGGGSSQPAAPTFGGGSSQPAAQTFGGGISQPAAQTFGGGISQPAVPSFAASQPAAPTFQFGQASSSPASAFQFNAAPPTVGGGMFSIGSGGSSASRTKTTALRRSHKRT